MRSRSTQQTNTCSKSSIETQEKRVFKVNYKVNKTTQMTFIVNFEHITHLFLVLLLLTLNCKRLLGAETEITDIYDYEKK